MAITEGMRVATSKRLLSFDDVTYVYDDVTHVSVTGGHHRRDARSHVEEAAIV